MRPICLRIILVEDSGAQALLLAEALRIRLDSLGSEDIVERLKRSLLLPHQHLRSEIFLKALYEICIHNEESIVLKHRSVNDLNSTTIVNHSSIRFQYALGQKILISHNENRSAYQ